MTVYDPKTRRCVALLGCLWLLIACGAPPAEESAAPATETKTTPIQKVTDEKQSPAGQNSSGDLSGFLSAPRQRSDVSLEETLRRRRSIRRFQDRPLSEGQVSQLLWSAQGITAGVYRTAPSAGATYPLDTYVVTAGGVYRYDPGEHRLTRTSTTDARPALSKSALGQTAVRDAPVVIVLVMVEERTRARYGDRATRYVPMEAGHAAQNLHLQAVALDLGSVPVGAFDEEEVAAILGCSAAQIPIYLIPVGYSATPDSN